MAAAVNSLIDPYHSVVFSTTYEEFLTRYPYSATLSSYSNPMLIFN